MSKTTLMHYVITRFSIHQPQWDTAGATDAWLEHRWPLFEACVESVKAQDVEFKWVLVCHHKMKTHWFDRLSVTLQGSEIDFTVLRTGRTWLFDLQQWLKAQHHRHLITTRLDSDDMLLPGFLEAIQNTVDKQNPKTNYFIDFPHGFKSKDNIPVVYTEHNNPFLSYVELGSICRSVYFIPHGSRINKYPIIKGKGRYWIQVIHPNNLRNK